MTLFSLLESLGGISHREGAEFLDVRLDTVKSWAVGRNPAPPGALGEMKGLIAMQERAAREALAMIEREAVDMIEIEIGYPADDNEALALGWPCVGAWAAMAARVVASSERPVRLVPRGSTPATATAIEARSSR